MFKVTKTGDNRIDLEIHGGLGAEEMKTGLDELLNLSEGMQGGALMYRIQEFEMPEFSALMVEFGRVGQLLGLIGRFRKCAVVCEQAWLRNMAQFEGMLIPSLTIKGFSLSQAGEAEAWLNSPDA